jgi:hypothetical protein
MPEVLCPPRSHWERRLVAGEVGGEAPVAPEPMRCPECGARGLADEDECNGLFQEVVGREFSRPELFHVHRLTVDAYSLQHPARYMKSAKSAVAHLTGMCWAMEGDDDPSISNALSRFLDGTPTLTRPEPVPPGGVRGGLNIVDVHSAEDSEQHIRLVKEWARSVWESWAEHHEKAREWVEEAKVKGRSQMGRR